MKVAYAHPPALVILDVMMPGLNGFQVLTALRANTTTRQVPVVMLSARAGEEASVEGLVAGANDYVVKPFAAAELTARVRTQIEAADARSQAEAAVTRATSSSRWWRTICGIRSRRSSGTYRCCVGGRAARSR